MDYEVTAAFYDHFASVKRADIDFFVGLSVDAKGPVLELGCGTGRILIPTAAAGVDITGLEQSSHMLAACRSKLAQQPAPVATRARLVQGDMRDFSLGRTFSLVTVPFRPFQHLTEVEDQLACLASIRRHLGDGGRLVLDLFNPSIPFLAGKTPTEAHLVEFRMPDGRGVRMRDRILARDLHRQVQDVEFAYEITHPDGRQEQAVERFPLRYLFRYEAEHLLARSGFRVEALYSDYDKSPYGAKYPGELIFVARKA